MADICAICRCLYENPKLLNCGHTFCCKCLEILIGSSKAQRVFKCPLCRAITKAGKHGADSLIDNFFVKSTLSTRIATCGSCKNISKLKTCTRCQVKLCYYCKISHQKSTNCIAFNESGIEYLHPVKAKSEQYDSLVYNGMRTKYVFVQEGKIHIVNFRAEGDRDVSLSLLYCFNDLLLAAPNGEMVAVFEHENGEEILRNNATGINVTGITAGTEGCPLIIRHGEYEVYEYSYGSLSALFATGTVLPKAIGRLKNGRIVIVGMRTLNMSDETQEKMEAAICIYEFDGTIVHEMSEGEDEFTLEFPTSVCVNMKNDDFYVGDTKRKEVVRFREDGTYVLSYKWSKALEPDASSNKMMENSDVFPMAIAYSQFNDLLFASLTTEAEQGICVLSPSLDLLGFFTASCDLGVPAGISCDYRDRLYVGDRKDGLIRKFNLTKFINIL